MIGQSKVFDDGVLFGALAIAFVSGDLVALMTIELMIKSMFSETRGRHERSSRDVIRHRCSPHLVGNALICGLVLPMTN